jgi:hypothetical protein
VRDFIFLFRKYLHNFQSIKITSKRYFIFALFYYFQQKYKEMKKILVLLILVLFVTACDKEDESTQEEVQQVEFLDLGTVKTQQIVRFSNARFVAQQYQATIGNKTISIEKFNDVEYVFLMPDNVDLGNQEMMVIGIDNFMISVNILQTIVTGSPEAALQPLFTNMSTFENTVDGKSLYGENVLAILDAFETHYETLPAADKAKLARLYSANQSFIDDAILSDYTRESNTQLELVSKYLLSVAVFSVATVAATIDPDPITKGVLAAVAAIALHKSYDYKDQLSQDTLKKVNMAINYIESALETRNMSALEIYNNQITSFPLETQDRILISSDENDSNENLGDFFNSFSIFNNSIDKLNIAIQFVNDTIWFSNISLFDRDYFPNTAAVEDVSADQDIFQSANFTISDSQVNLNNVSFENGNINITASISNPDFQGDFIDTFLEYTYRDDFNEFEGKFPVKVNSQFYNYKIQFGKYNPNFDLIEIAETFENGDTYTVPNYITHHVRLLLDDEPVAVGQNGLGWTAAILGELPTSGETMNVDDYGINIYDETNKRSVTISLDMTFVNAAYSQISGNTFTVEIGDYGVPNGTIFTLNFNTDGTYVSYYSDGTVQREGVYDFRPYANSYEYNDCQDYVYRGRGVASIQLSGQSSGAYGPPEYFMFYADGMILANSFYGCFNQFRTYHIN